MRLSEVIRQKKQGKKWVVLTAYDYPSAQAGEAAGVDWLLVGDSIAMVYFGEPDTTGVTMETMERHAGAVVRGAPNTPVIGDLPLEAVRRGPSGTLEAARRFTAAGCSAVKLEWSPKARAAASKIAKAGIPLMGHVGLTPQTAGDFRVKGSRAADAARIYREALEFRRLGAFSVVVECVPAAVGAAITRALDVPTIGIGAGRGTDGQVLVYHDVVGRFDKFTPRFAKRYAETGRVEREAARRFASDVRRGRFPRAEHEYGMDARDRKDFENAIAGQSGARRSAW